MSTQSNRDFRPEFHYTPPFGWINDPNGLLYENGTWHLFAQHNPKEPVWGPMHWRHATSTDLLHWKDLGIAMAPDEKLGMIFSGSAVIDKGNTSGLGDGCDPMILMFTHHGEHEQQSIAYSNDRVHFTPYAGNPVIPNDDKLNFRDPKVFRNEILNCWSVVLAAGDHADIYASDDLIHWRKTGEFGAKENRLGGVFECTDMFPMKAPDGGTVWALIVSTALNATFGSGRMQYFLGEFDGNTFVETYPSPYPRFLDSGYDNYAAVTFSNTDRLLMVGWAASPGYAGFMPTNEFCCCMTYVRELRLIETDAGLQIAARPITPKFDMKDIAPDPAPDPMPRWPHMYIPRTEGKLPGDVFHLNVEAGSSFSLTLSNDDGEELTVALSTDQQLVIDRSKAGIHGFHAVYDSGIGSVMRPQRKLHGPVTVDLYFDRMIAEIFMDGGSVVNTSIVFPEKPYTKAVLMGRAALRIGGVKE